eukprot:gene4038-7327_t
MKFIVLLCFCITLLMASEILFPDEQWNKFKDTEDFIGTLVKTEYSEYHPIIQRFNPYKLVNGTKTTDIYTGADNVKALNRYLGFKVLIKGKLMKYELEGSIITEIWPSEIEKLDEEINK